MRNDTKLDILWEEMGTANSELAAVKAVTDEVAPLIPKIPKDYSTEETDTGLKWIDGRNIYEKVITGQFPEITATANQIVGNIGTNELIFASNVIINANGSRLHDRFSLTITQTGDIQLLSVSSSVSEANYFTIVKYVKPAPTREPDGELETKKATKKKTTKNKED